MSESPDAVVDRFLERLAAGDVDGVLACFDEHSVEFVIPHAPGIAWIPEADDRASMRQFFEALQSDLEPELFEVDGRVSSGHEVALRGRLRSVVRATGRTIDSPISIWLTVQDGFVTRYHFYEDSYQVAHAAGVA